MQRTTEQLLQELIEEILPPEAIRQFSQGKISHNQLVPFVSELLAISSAYVEHTPGSLLQDRISLLRQAEAYALYYLPINYAKLTHVLKPFAPSDGARILDFGSGPATGALSALAFGGKGFEITCIDHSAPMREIAQRLLSRHIEAGRVAKLSLLAQLPSGECTHPFDLILAANVFAEMPESLTLETIDHLIRSLSETGVLVILEPGQSAHTRRLMAVRDTVRAKWGDLQVLFPCCRQDACPMLRVSESDWCHDTISWARPEFIRQLDELLGFNKHRLKYSAFAFGRRPSATDAYRVVVGGSRDKRGSTAVVCGQNYYGTVRIPSRERGPHNKALEKAPGFSLLAFSAKPDDNLPSGTHVTAAK